MTPRAYAFAAARAADGTLILLIDCPLCPQAHAHGWAEYPESPGIRTAHCDNTDSATYNVIVPAGITIVSRAIPDPDSPAPVPTKAAYRCLSCRLYRPADAFDLPSRHCRMCVSDGYA